MARLTTKDFITKAKAVHGDKYDYSKVEYVNAKGKITIICPKHGEFEQMAYNHLVGINCPKCSGRNKTKDEIINEFKAVHGDKYDYSKVEYVNSKTKLIIGCPKHGEFEQTMKNHLKGGCPVCAGRIRNNSDFIMKAREIHGDRYDYSKMVYKNPKTKIIIICPEHGEFEQTPTGHLSGRGCLKCAGKYMDTEYFKEKASKLHNNKYDYSKVIYKHNAKKVIIICREHGEFLQTPNSHFNGTGCPDCGKILQAENRSLSTEEFIRRAREIHGDKYDYSKTIYVNAHEKLMIICPEHGSFLQEPTVHLSGGGCSKCSGRYLDYDFFIEKAKKTHGDKYDYSKVVYVNSQTKVTILCPLHGEFEQTPSQHIGGNSCPKCHGRGFKYASFEVVKEIIRKEQIKSPQEYYFWWNNNIDFCRENGIPLKPDRFYSKHQ